MSTTWHLAPCLATLRSQLDQAYPGRARISDGTLGDPRHQAEGTPSAANGWSGSDHNPDIPDHSVNAFDVTHGPYYAKPGQKAPDIDCRILAADLIASGDKRIRYIILERRWWKPDGHGWRPYTGPSPHLEHLHLSVNHDSSENDANEWNLPHFVVDPPPPIHIDPPPDNPPPPPAALVDDEEEAMQIITGHPDYGVVFLAMGAAGNRCTALMSSDDVHAINGQALVPIANPPITPAVVAQIKANQK